MFQVKDVIEDAIEGKLDTSNFPFLSDQRQGANKAQAPARYEATNFCIFGRVVIHCVIHSCFS